jgi:hypothetical protein
MNVGKVIGYFSSFIGFIFLLVAFFVGLSDMFDFETASLLSASADPGSAVLSLFLAAAALWIILAFVMFVIGGLGFYVGRNKNPAKLSSEADEINDRLDRLERIIEENSKKSKEKLNAVEEKQQNTS